MRSIRIPLALLLAGTIVGCGLTLGLDEYEQVCEAPGCRACAVPSDCGAPPLCFSWTCEANVCTQRPSSPHTTCPLGVCDGDGQCVGCVTVDNCGVSTACEEWTCAKRICTRTLPAAGTPVTPQTEGDCKQAQCDGKGGEVSVVEAQGTACTVNNGKLCDEEGNCVQCLAHADCSPSGSFCDPGSKTCFRCNDGKKNGDETDVDCGGNFCPKCAQGKACIGTSNCSTGFCVDGFCCDSSCDGTCETCSLPGATGQCNFIPKYGEDPSYGLSDSCLARDNLACTGLGGCKGILGLQCTGPSQCASQYCADPDGNGQKTCVKGPGDPCAQHVECYNNLCSNGLCAP